MKKIIQLISDFFIHNAVGWGLVFADGAVISFLLWFSSGVIHTQMPSDGIARKATVISAYKFNGGDLPGGLSDLTMIIMIILNSPALHLSNFAYETLFVSKSGTILPMDQSCKFCWVYLSQIGCDIFFIIIQWLIVGAVIKRLIRLVKESN